MKTRMEIRIMTIINTMEREKKKMKKKRKKMEKKKKVKKKNKIKKKKKMEKKKKMKKKKKMRRILTRIIKPIIIIIITIIAI